MSTLTTTSLLRADRAERVRRARLYLCTDARQGPADLAAFADQVLAAGVDIIQLRHKGIEAQDELAALRVLRTACRRHGRLLAVNDRADVAVLAQADVLHVGQRDLPPAAARQVVGPDVVIGLSSHSARQAVAAAAEVDVDYFCVGPLWATPTKPGRVPIGLDPLREVARAAPGTPWFAIGGVEESTVDEVVAAGATRAVVVRALTQAADPAGAVGRLRAVLERAG